MPRGFSSCTLLGTGAGAGTSLLLPGQVSSIVDTVRLISTYPVSSIQYPVSSIQYPVLQPPPGWGIYNNKLRPDSLSHMIDRPTLHTIHLTMGSKLNDTVRSGNTSSSPIK
ncbi:hypothetical protein BO94DRAFT_80286 [Aspergillus sclerotioniger CBS 115572]|uniref:Uncharacterized protein n=1 Tax=Aspergillus sclerotioniger CBS 115572 TaxID=1450535 RepID=A0A317WKX5_9EURO|nr:hypothetical protein BO94DRAFT_80286 [Aspergillus sclerotioniger CBS 115572]PWY86361.1 hypothetical protein BO94DRAFT_80286 [Aspergillus sclerotioniger CBS 115572]